MKNITFKMLGLTSSLLSTAGLLSAAERFDPLTHSAAKQPSISMPIDPPADGCTNQCWYFESNPQTSDSAQR